MENLKPKVCVAVVVPQAQSFVCSSVEGSVTLALPGLYPFSDLHLSPCLPFLIIFYFFMSSMNNIVNKGIFISY